MKEILREIAAALAGPSMSGWHDAQREQGQLLADFIGTYDRARGS